MRPENLPGFKPWDRPMSNERGKWSVQVLWIGPLIFVLALALRLLFLDATADSGNAYSPYYKGDTPVWLEYAGAIRSSQAFDLGLPMRPPGVAYLVALVWNPQADDFTWLRLIWSVGGAAAVALLFVAVFRSFGLLVAVVAATFAAASTGLMILSNSPNNEIPYLLLVIGSLTLWEPVRHRPRLRALLPWCLLNGLACLVRVEHLLFFALVSVYLVWAWSHAPGLNANRLRGLGRAALLPVLFVLPLIPWHLHSWAEIEEFNRRPLPLNPATERAYRQLEVALTGLSWTEDAEREREALPAFCRRPLANFVAATVAYRGGREVTAEDFRIIDEAFGSVPGPIAARPFVALYGGLNFYLANNPWSTGGFTRAPLEVPPPLAGGAHRYPPFLVAGLPPPELVFSYPPHVEIVRHGYRLGWSWILEHPVDFLALAAGKLRIFWSGLTLGLGGYNLPLGMSGLRRAVDLVVPDATPTTALWRGSALLAMLLGFWAGRREEALRPWLLLLATKVATTLVFFGYAREGAVLIPVFALSLGLLTRELVARRSRATQGLTAPRPWKAGLATLCLLAVGLVALEGYRWYSQPEVTLDGREVGDTDPIPGTEYEDRELRVR
jgi:hypothetical protein